MADNTPYDQAGKIETASGLVDKQTGAITMRATFPNSEGLLRSGGSGAIRIPREFDSAILIPQNATYELQGNVSYTRSPRITRFTTPKSR